MKTFYKLLLLGFIILGCSNDSSEEYVDIPAGPTPSPLNIPQVFENQLIDPIIPADNPQTEEGIALGKKLFFDPILSLDFSQACASCHMPQNSFTDSNTFSTGVNGDLGIRNSMPLFNLAWNFDEHFFWDGRSFGLEHQASLPVEDPTEMANTWETVVDRLINHSEYPELFQAAFGNAPISRNLATKALAQFERTLISANSKFDNYFLGTASLTPQEQNGLAVFMDEDRGDCFHCHGNPNNPLWTDNAFHNNALDSTFSDNGLGDITGDPADNGKFKTPSLRNLAYTAPYMHDGRFATLDEVINHYSEGLQNSPTVDPLMKTVNQGGVQLTEQDKADLKAFLLSLSDPSFLNNPDFIP
ncbi:cytochrome-c peroxidase [Mangrovimonas futianensis]|uniref:cytochrome-c peroxidase n=1 Tax=Mangrovimonas futianensis TaxID=2895523 RepID=UPI001E2E5114|nr:cytochrome c peroxidase [Mangrovimonas futianensis]MCF1420637.1 cytochrome-c peroxidase [Mangrovimonas futianensis]